MKIEDEIKQPKFQSEYHKLGVNLAFTANWFDRQITQKLKEFKLTGQQFNVLRILRGQYPNPATINLITERMLDKMSNASRLVDKLLAKGLVDRRTCPEDRRQVDIVITEKGQELLKKIDEQTKEWEAPLMTLSKQEAKLMNDLLDRMRGN
jgi:DNA-binding MarR family transcriptional regulator